MIHFKIDKGRSSYFLDLTGSFPNRMPVIVKQNASLLQLRGILRNQLTAHLNMLLEDLLGLAMVNATFEPAVRVRKDLIQLIKDYCSGDHVRYAHRVIDQFNDMHMLFCITEHPLMMTRLMQDIERTVGYMVTHPDSLWVFGQKKSLMNK